MKTTIILALLALTASAAAASAQDYYRSHGHHGRYLNPPRAANGQIAERREVSRSPWGWDVNGNANGNNLTRSNGQ